ncbi:MAG: acyl-protein synthetase, partial [Gemmatimonas sp.]|nr:acyl-protein synthetase [Gemmatimonas sp.]
RGFCEARSATPATVGHWSQIPAVPTDAFKAAPIVSGDPAEAAAVFRTSGTALGAGRRGTHYMLDTALYRAALRVGFGVHLLPEGGPIRIAALVPPPSELPDSSLSFMVGDVLETFGADRSRFYVRKGDLDLNRFVADARDAIVEGQRVLVAGTSFAFVYLLDGLAAAGIHLSLPPGSRAMDTGGFKARSREVERAELYGMIEVGLGIPAAYIVNEYGMTEMSSQFYDGIAGEAAPIGAGRLHHGPPWVRTVAADPNTLEPLDRGAVGILRHLDLANLDSVAAIQTADLGAIADGGFELGGRAEGAEARGCSIATDELLEVMRRGIEG